MEIATWETALAAEWDHKRAADAQPPLLPLASLSIGHEELIDAVRVLLSGQLTMGAVVREFEREFAKFIGSPYAVMVNSGSSANLLAVAVACNFRRENALQPGDEVLVPSLCWSTSVAPLLQHGLKPIFLDIDPQTLNVQSGEIARKLTPRTRAIFAVHVLGNCGPMDEILQAARDHNLLLIEDTCESLGSMWRDKYLGAAGQLGTYSFFFSHHMTTGEGGMVICQEKADYELLLCLRAHGWTRELSDRPAWEAANPGVDPRFLFVNVGYNVRPVEIEAAIGLCQLRKLPAMNAARVANRTALIDALRGHSAWRGQLEFPHAAENSSPVWFGFPFIVAGDERVDMRQFAQRLSGEGVENRPIVSGNFARQPVLRDLGLDIRATDYPGAERATDRGLFISLPSTILSPDTIALVADVLLTSL
ncbi:MAG TPA: DegT/DnrJ/EryC1/StrS family aminotransferase [Capsulimonadaceae bacterium]|jgi:CDP-6-deoxy-D-xylo-4-hexulose-3-dehydrase